MLNSFLPAGGEQTLGAWLDHRATVHGAKIAVDDRGVTTSYRELATRINALAQKLQHDGFQKGSTVVSISGNSVDQIVLFFACAKLGLILCPLSWRLTVGELADLVDRVQPALIVYEDEYVTLAKETLKASDVTAPFLMLQDLANLTLNSQNGAITEIDSTPAEFAKSEGATKVLASDPLLLIFTSGSEAKPKGVLLSHANCFWNNLSLAGVSGVSDSDVALCVLPQFHVGGWNIYPLLALWSGATLILERTFQAKRVIELISKRKVTVMMGVPTQYELLTKEPDFESADLSSIRMAQVGGASFSRTTLQRWHEKNIYLSQGYGLTEASPNVLYTPKNSIAKGMHPYPHAQVRLVEDGKETKTRGELQVSGPGVFLKYFDDEEATSRTFTADGWLKTGDIAEYDTHGGLHIVGRIKDIYISGGENVAPAEIEHVLGTHEAVAESAVVGIPDPIWGEVGCAFVAPSQTFKNVGKEQLKEVLFDHLKDHLATFKIPKEIVFLTQIPKIGIDKADRTALKARAFKLSSGVDANDRN